MCERIIARYAASGAEHPQGCYTHGTSMMAGQCVGVEHGDLTGRGAWQHTGTTAGDGASTEGASSIALACCGSSI
jgi:hypothetical protein